MSGFGDYEDADAYDVADPDPEQVARKLAALEGIDWDDMTPQWRVFRIDRMVRLLAWLHRQGPA